MKIKLIKDCKISGLEYKKETNITVTNGLGRDLVNIGKAVSEEYKKPKEENNKSNNKSNTK